MKILRIVLSFWVIAIMIGQPVAQAQSSSAVSGSSPIATPTQDGLTLEWRVPYPSLTTQPAGETEIKIPDFLYENTPGMPELPFSSALVALPAQGSVALETQILENQPVDFNGKLAVVPFKPDQTTSPLEAQMANHLEKIQLVEIGTQRGVRLARVMFHPVLPKDGKLDLVTHLKILVRFSPPLTPAPATTDPILQQIRSQVVNPTQVMPAQDSIFAPADAAGFANSGAYAIEVDRPGIVQVSFEQLAAANFPANQISPNNLALTQAGQNVSFEWVAPQGATTGPAFRFYAHPRFSRWMNNDVYLLSPGGGGTAMQQRSTVPGVNNHAWTDVVLEQNNIYTPDCLDCAPIPLGRDGDRWVWDELSSPGADSKTYPFSVSNVDASANATLTIWLIGKTDLPTSNPDHQLTVFLNGFSLGSVTWNGKTSFNPSFTIPAGRLLSGGNSLNLVVPAMSGVTIDSFWMDAFNIHYRLGGATNGSEVTFSGDVSAGSGVSYSFGLDASSGVTVYNITNPLQPIHLVATTQNSNTRVTFGDLTSPSAQSYIVASDAGIHAPTLIRALKPLSTSATSGANYVILAPEGYDAVLQPLVNLRASQHYHVAVEHLQPIYDQFNEGRLDPLAIRSYLQYTYTHWDPKPAYVLLVGDGNIDPKKYRSTDFDTILPAFFVADIDPYTTDSATDNRYVTLSGNPNQVLPDMMIGRLPANSTAEAQAMVDKIVASEVSPTPGAWRSRTLFVADQYFDGGASRLAKLVTPTIFNTPTQLYYMKNINDPAVMHSSIINNWNQGASLILYTGHAAVHFWSAASFFHITNDLGLLTNAGKLPVVLEMTCFTGTFQMGSLSSMDEQLIRKPNGGALAVWGSTSEGLSNGHEYLAQGFINNITKDTANNPTHNLGLATYAGRLNVAMNNPQNNYLIDSFILFGDPLSRVTIDLTPKQGVILPLVRK